MSTTGRDETPDERADRNWVELLQELRVSQTGVQILFSLLLTVPFSARFDEIDAFQERVYVACLLLAAAAILTLVTPVMYHRLLFHEGDKEHVVTHSARLSVVGTLLGVLAVGGILLLILDVVVGRAAGLLAGAAYVLLAAWLFVGAGLRRRARVRRSGT
ncbi:MAG: integral rane protein [Frankiales bacterium]|nr:integral rane protein [Frankiales bacterium]